MWRVFAWRDFLRLTVRNGEASVPTQLSSPPGLLRPEFPYEAHHPNPSCTLRNDIIGPEWLQRATQSGAVMAAEWWEWWFFRETQLQIDVALVTVRGVGGVGGRGHLTIYAVEELQLQDRWWKNQDKHRDAARMNAWVMLMRPHVQVLQGAADKHVRAWCHRNVIHSNITITHNRAPSCFSLQSSAPLQQPQLTASRYVCKLVAFV